MSDWKCVWQTALSGLSGERIAAGLDRCFREREWPPIEPAGFIKLCRPSCAEMGVPEVEEALMIVCLSGRNELGVTPSHADRWKHPVVLAAAMDARIDLHRIRNASQDKALAVWAPVYSEYVTRMADGEVFAFPDQDDEGRALDDRRRKAVTAEEKAAAKASAESHLRAMRESLGGRDA